VPASAGLPPLAGSAAALVTGTVVALALLAVAVAAGVVVLARLLSRLAALEAARGQPDQSLLLLQRQIENARAEGHDRQAETLTSVREELRQLASQVTAQVGQVSSGVQRDLQHVGQVMGAVHGSLGKLGEATQRVFDVGRDIAGLEQLLRSPKVRGGLGELLLENLLAQMLPQDHWTLQHAFPTGDRVDAAVRIGDRIVPVDAKFPLENFRRMVEEPDDERRRVHRRAFVRDVKNRVDEIAKRYIRPDDHTFDFALMYVPAEPVYYEIIARDDPLEDEAPAAYALSRRVVPVSPNSLYAYLQVIVLGLRGLRIERDARDIQARLLGLRADLERFRDAFEVVGKHLTNARNKHDEAAAALDRVEGKLLGMESREQPSLPGLAP
jgi:DNA recombination protein RmuC